MLSTDLFGEEIPFFAIETSIYTKSESETSQEKVHSHFQTKSSNLPRRKHMSELNVVKKSEVRPPLNECKKKCLIQRKSSKHLFKHSYFKTLIKTMDRVKTKLGHQVGVDSRLWNLDI